MGIGSATISTFGDVKTHTKNLSDKIEDLIKASVKMRKDFREKIVPKIAEFTDNVDLRVTSP